MALDGDITRNKILEFISKIDKVSNEEFEQIVIQIHDGLRADTEGKSKSADKQSKDYYLELLVNCYLQSTSERILKILVGLSSPLNECLFNIMMNKISGSSNTSMQNRQSVLILISRIVHQTPAWLSQIINLNILDQFFNILKNEEEVVLLGTSALILVELIATLPSIISQCLSDIFNCFSRLSTFLYKKTQQNDRREDVFFLHLNSIVYRLFFRLYAMYPCNFIQFLQSNYGMGGNKVNSAVFNKIIEPMLSRIRFHPLLITASKDKECDKQRWFYKEAHDILDECGRYAIDPIEFYQESELCGNFGGEDHDNDNNDDGDDELCQLTDSISDEEPMAKEFIEQQNSSTSPPPPQQQQLVETNSDIIFSKLNKDIYSARGETISRLGTLTEASHLDTSKSSKNAEFAEEAIFLGNRDDAGRQNTIESSASKFSPIHNKSVVVPVAISAVAKINNGNNNNNSFQLQQQQQQQHQYQRKYSNKTVCFSPFKPIKEVENGSEFKHVKNNNKSPSFNFNVAHNSLSIKTQFDTQFHTSSAVDNEEEDIEIMRISSNFQEHKTTADTDKNNSNNLFSPLSELKTNGGELNVLKQNSSAQLSKNTLKDDHLLAAQLVGNIKNSLKKASSRIRYQSHCLPETDKEHNDFYYAGQSPSGSLTNLRVFSKSCPILYFKTDDELTNSGGLVANGQTVCLSNDDASSINNNDKPQVIQSGKGAQGVSTAVEDGGSQAKVNLILENPDPESSRMNKVVINRKKACKSVDYSKEARQKHRHRHESSALSKTLWSEQRRRDIFESTSSVDIHPHTADALHRKFTPHQMLDQMLFLNSQMCRKELVDRNLPTAAAAAAGGSNNQSCLKDEVIESHFDSQRNSILNTTNSSTSSMENIPSANLGGGLNMSDESMRRQLAIMYAQLLFERHQRDSHVIRNRRLYKKLKEYNELQEKVCTLQEQLRVQRNEQIRIEGIFTSKLAEFKDYRKVLKDKIDAVEGELARYKEKCQALENEKASMEKRYKEEIKSLHLNHRTTEVELNRYLCSYNGKNVDVANLEAENSELKNQLFLFGEFYTKIRNSYMQNRNVTDLNDKLCIEGLKYDKEVLTKQVNDLNCKLSASLDKCSNLELQLKQLEQKNKLRNESKITQMLQDSIQLKNEQIKNLKSIIVNYDKHIYTLNGQINAKEQFRCTNDVKTA